MAPRPGRGCQSCSPDVRLRGERGRARGAGVAPSPREQHSGAARKAEKNGPDRGTRHFAWREDVQRRLKGERRSSRRGHRKTERRGHARCEARRSSKPAKTLRPLTCQDESESPFPYTQQNQDRRH